MRVEPGPFLDEKLWKASLKATAVFSASVLVDKQSGVHNSGLIFGATYVFCVDMAYPVLSGDKPFVVFTGVPLLSFLLSVCA
jgi:hypothetical protein